MPSDRLACVRFRRRMAVVAAGLGGCVLFGIGSNIFAGDRESPARTWQQNDSNRNTLYAARKAAPRKVGSPIGQVQLPTTLEDFFQPGTQPDPTGLEIEPVISNTSCQFCHGEYLPEPSVKEPWDGWIGSLMAQSARDPVWHAALAISNQDAAGSGEFCIRCHAPGAWLGGRSASGTIDDFIVAGNVNDFDGVNCHFCHRAVDPVYKPGISPVEDAAILAALDFPPGSQTGNARFVIDPDDVRRGPYEDVATNPNMNLHGVPVLFSPYHSSGEMCATCHDVMNPLFMRQGDGSYALAPLDAPHPTQDPYDMFPEQTTASEWRFSAFADTGVHFPDGRFGGAHPTGIMHSCQDCHMPKRVAGGCFAWQWPPFFERQDLGEHTFAGSNHWVLRAVREIYPDFETNLSEEIVEDSIARNIELLRAASDTTAVQSGDKLQVRVTNYSGHKLPTGYPEGRRMWLNVRYFDESDDLIEEFGEYDYVEAQLDEESTKVYQAKHGMDESVANVTNLSAGKSFHLSLNNVVLFDNRIPPIGFTNAAFEQFGGQPVGQTYADGQHWDDTNYPIPPGAVRAVVTLYYQVATREYIEFLRDANVTNNWGQTLYDLWLDPNVGNKVPPVDMDVVEVVLTPVTVGDLDGNGVVDSADLLILLTEWGPCPDPLNCPADLDCDGVVNSSDLLLLLSNWG